MSGVGCDKLWKPVSHAVSVAAKRFICYRVKVENVETLTEHIVVSLFSCLHELFEIPEEDRC